MAGAYGVSNETTKELVGKSFEEVIDHLYTELDKCSEGDINNVRTLLVSLFAASLVGLTPHQTAEQLQRIVDLLKAKVKVIPDEGV